MSPPCVTAVDLPRTCTVDTTPLPAARRPRYHAAQQQLEVKCLFFRRSRALSAGCGIYRAAYGCSEIGSGGKRLVCVPTRVHIDLTHPQQEQTMEKGCPIFCAAGFSRDMVDSSSSAAAAVTSIQMLYAAAAPAMTCSPHTGRQVAFNQHTYLSHRERKREIV